jgi:hypothetical protein
VQPGATVPEPGGDDSCRPKLIDGHIRSVAETARVLEAGGEGYRERQAAIARCAACHPEEYRDWQADPHSRSRLSVLRFYTRTFAPQSPMSDQEREDFKVSDPVANCCNCHCPTATVHEQQVPGGWDRNALEDLKPLCVPPDAELVSDGVDCITCHRRGEQVVAGRDYTPGKVAAPQGACSPRSSEVLSDIAGCAGCHDQVSYLSEYRQGAGRNRPFVHCDECHRHRDAKGRYLHRYLSHQERRDGLARAAFERLDARVKGQELQLDWKQDFSPHALAHMSVIVYVLKIEVLDSTAKTLLSRDYRFYSAAELTDPGDMDLLARHNPGAEFVSLNPGDAFSRRVALESQDREVGAIRVRVFEKEKFDFPDTEMVMFLDRTLPHKP